MEQVLSHSMSFQEQYRLVLRELYKETSHPSLVNPYFDPTTDRILLGLADMLAKFAKCELDDWYAQIMALLCVHQGLRVHATIPDEPIRLNDQDRQLAVLAGYYYSSKYYSILVRNNLVSFVAHLADAIQKINENKASYSKKDSLSQQSYQKYLGNLTITT